MGCCQCQEDVVRAVVDDDAVREYLAGRRTLKDLWNQFDKNADGNIDTKEFKDMVGASFKFFCIQRCPNEPPPSIEFIESNTERIFKALYAKVDQNKDDRITWEEFKTYGEYITADFENLKQELAGKNTM